MKKATTIVLSIIVVLIVVGCVFLCRIFQKPKEDTSIQTSGEASTSSLEDKDDLKDIEKTTSSELLNDDLEKTGEQNGSKFASIISFSRRSAGYIQPPDIPNNPDAGSYGYLLIGDEEDTFLFSNEDVLHIGQEMIFDNISFRIIDAVLSEKEGNFADSKKSAEYVEIFVVVKCDVKNLDNNSSKDLSSKYSFCLLAENNNVFFQSNNDEKECFECYKTITPDTLIKGVTISFSGSRGFLTNADDLKIVLLRNDEPIACWKIEPSFES